MPWNAVDKAGRCAGEYASEQNHEDAAKTLLDAGESQRSKLAVTTSHELKNCSPQVKLEQMNIQWIAISIQ